MALAESHKNETGSARLSLGEANVAPTQLPELPIVPPSLPHLPSSRAEMEQRGWDCVDVVFVTGDAYVDHPAFAMGILSRVLEAAGFRVAVLSQPDWRSADPWRQFGRPRLFFGVSAGNMDSMINHYTANKKVRNDDAYSPGGRIGLRPDRATLAYCQRAREAFPGVPVIAGGVEASLRRLAHYDYWSDTVKRSILLDSKADLVVFGMGEQAIVEIARRLAAAQTVKDLRDLRGVAYALGAQRRPRRRDRAPSFDEVGPTRSSSPEPRKSFIRRPTRSTPGAWSSTMTARPSSPMRLPCRSARKTWTGSTVCRTPGAPTRCTATSRFRPTRRSRIR